MELTEEVSNISGRNSPNVWVLTDDRPGNTTQSLGLADSLGWPYEVKRLDFTPLARLHKIHEGLIGSTTLCLNLKTSSPLVSPWPDVVICAGRRPAPIARWIRSQSRGRTKLIQLGRKGSQAVAQGDITIAPAYCRMWPHDHHIETLAPLNRVSDQQLESAAREWSELYHEAARPYVVLLVGGSTVRSVFDEGVARQLGKDVRAFSEKIGGTVHAVTSRRTGQKATDALCEGLGPHVLVRRWEPGHSPNPYWGYLSVADLIIVTGDSESMVGESVSVGKPVYIYPLPERPLRGFARVREAIVVAGWRSQAMVQEPVWTKSVKRLCGLLLRKGFVRPLRDLQAFHRVLVERGYAQMFGRDLEAHKGIPLRETDQVGRKIKEILGFQE
ncbi:MAG: mitochondrial fission ELM1 family protein [Nitrospirales bacterium]|nr:mitochondrial fission ELM1 family protein [Nitrospira sp.]MDR4503130.1 mitochondrial fission ELM1 family protein [Nitrospirales bacterium]